MPGPISFLRSDTVGIKVNCSGAPEINSNPELVSAIIDNLIALGVPANRIYIYDRFENQLRIVNFGPKVAAGVKISGAESARGSILGYDPYTYVEVDFFGEDDTRSNLIRLVSDTLTKVINVPTMKEHRAAGVTGCLKNIAYGDFSNVARSHQKEKTNTYSFIGTLAVGRAAAIENGSEHYGRPAQPLAGRSVFAESEISFLSETDCAGNRSGRARSRAPRHD